MTKFAKLLTGFAAAGMLLLSTSAPSNAQQTCGPRDHALGQLEKRHQEKVFGRGLATNGKAMFELFVSSSGSWTVLASDPSGRSCVVAGGDSWHEVKGDREGSV